ncbi:hypothetical protein [Aquimarina pacifica]|uniref:hypothetical protein n=1 Tax=Aquimarina pacifica TaxID=1296415 RepID=UPI0004716B62|nr:hypothetical protein [Aquimarina pacifica]
MIKEIVRFLFLCSIVLVVGYFIHSVVVKYLTPTKDFFIINFSYVFNGVFSCLLTIIIVVLREKFKDQVGFIFMAGSLVKLGLFLVISRVADLEIHKSVFLDFFIAYVICLILEVYWVSRILKDYK